MQESVTTDAECEGLKHVTGGDVLITGAGWALGREQVNSFAYVKEFRERPAKQVRTAAWDVRWRGDQPWY